MLLIKNSKVGEETCCQQNALKDKVKSKTSYAFLFLLVNDAFCKVIASLED